MNYFDDIPCGETLPLNNVHAISVSMPQMSDVIAYEEKDPKIKEKIKSGYPRFVTHPFIVKIQQHLHIKLGISNDKEIIILSSQQAVERLFDFIHIRYDVITDHNITGVCIPRKEANDLKNARLFLQHTGFIPSSRQAEQYLIDEGVLFTKYQEAIYADKNPYKHIKEVLANAYRINNNVDILLCNCGMNAIFASHSVLRKIQKNNGKDIIIQFGWLYLDTMEIIKKLSSEYVFIKSVTSINDLEKVLMEKGDNIAAIFTEVTSNPLIQTPNLPVIKKLAAQFNIPIVVDVTLGTPYNVDVTPFSDIIIESLTKFACGNADLMMGTLILNKQSYWHNEIRLNIHEFIEKPYERDIQRLSFEIEGYEARIKKINKNTLELVRYFQKSKKVKEMYWPYQEKTKQNYMAIQRQRDAVGGVISIVFDEPLKNIYDNIKLPKGPSLGTEFTLLMPYMYLAHYDLVSNKKGRKYLKSVGIHPDLLRISVGIEDVEMVIKAFEEVLV